MTQTEGIVTSVSKYLRDVMCAWWRQDRIRISPRKGWLWRMQPDGWISVCGEVVKVVSRTVGQTGRGAYIEHECESDRGSSRLRAEPAAVGEVPRWVWFHGGRSRVIGADEVRPNL